MVGLQPLYRQIADKMSQSIACLEANVNFSHAYQLTSNVVFIPIVIVQKTAFQLSHGRH